MGRLLEERPLPRDGAEPGAGARAGKAGDRPRRSVLVNMAESPLGWLKARGLVSERQYEAGEMLRAQWEQAQLGPHVTMNWDMAAPASRSRRAAPTPAGLTPAQAAARKRFDSAVKAVGPGLTDILWRIVCAGEGMRDAERALGWPARTGRLVLGFALDRLADHYRLP